MKNIHILLVEDNEGDILLIEEALNEQSITTKLSVVRDGWEAIQFLEQKGKYQNEQNPDLVLLDVNLPKMNGHEVLASLKSNTNLKHIPVIILTTSSTEKDILLSYRGYANCFITKPAEGDHFCEVVSAIENFWTTKVQLPNKTK